MEQKKAVRVLQIGLCDGLFGGVERVVLNWYKTIEKNKIQFDFLSPYKSTYETHRKEIEKLGGNIYTLGIKRDGVRAKLRYNRALKEFLIEHQYKIVHINSGLFLFQLQVVLACRRAKVPVVISHSHSCPNFSFIKKIIVNILKPLLFKKSTVRLACSKTAAYSIFPKKRVDNGQVIQIKNGIDTKKFKYSADNRKKWRKEFGVRDEVVYVNVGRFSKEKNHEFLIKVFSEIYKKQNNAKLVLVGEGPLKPAIMESVKNYGIEDAVVFLPASDCVCEILSAADVYIIPSLFEGFPVTGLEAQASGLPVFYSSSITNEIEITDHVYPISLESSAKEWANTIVSHQPFSINRANGAKEVFDAGYDFTESAKEIEEIYLKYV